MKESPAGMIQKYVYSWIKCYENPIFLKNIKFIPKGYHNCQLSIVNCQFDKFQFPGQLSKADKLIFYPRKGIPKLSIVHCQLSTHLRRKPL